MAKEAADVDIVVEPTSKPVGDDFILDEVLGPDETLDEEIVVKDADEELEVEIEEKTKVEDSETAQLKKALSETQKDLLKVSQSLHDLTTKKDETPKGKEEKLTRSQIVNVLKEHKDDPEVLFNVIDYLAEEKALSTRDKTLEDVNRRSWEGNLSGISGRILAEDKLLSTKPEHKGVIAEYARNLGLDNHPAGHLAAHAIYVLSELNKDPSTLFSVYGKPTSEANSDRVDAIKRTKTLDKTKTSSASPGKGVGLSSEEAEIAKKFGVNPKLYARFLHGRK